MNILVSGSTGLIGSALAVHLESRGDRVIRLVRSSSRRGDRERPGGTAGANASAAANEGAGANDRAIVWDPAAGHLDAGRLEGLDAIVHLSGESIVGGRWTATRKARLRASRIGSTGLLVRAIAGLKKPPRVFLCASAVGYYGDRSDEILEETSAPGSDFLADLCRAWEEAAAPVGEHGVRVVAFRTGIVLSARGGALKPILRVFRLGLGGTLGAGRQWMSCIALDDLVAAMEHALGSDALRGGVNAVAPEPVTNVEFTKTLARVLRRPAFLPVPSPLLRIVLGELAGAILASTRAVPAKLLRSGFRFRFPDLESALRHVLAEDSR